MAKNKFSPGVVKSFTPPPRYTCPAVSVIIPMYNVEKYVGECLDSLLVQTLENFEVIVVDDCSTDSSAAVVESYTARFNGRLKLIRMKKNSGHCSIPRNVGLPYARGEYIYFMDSDDAITPTALEELYGLAKEFDADVVHCEKYLDVPDDKWHDAEFRKNIKPYSWWTKGDEVFVTEPTLLTENFEQRAVEFTRGWLMWVIWVQLFRREFILDNELKFVHTFCEDKVFTICAICSAKKYLVVPNIIYHYRQSKDSLSRSSLDMKSFRKDVKGISDGIKYLDEYLSEHEPFSHRIDLKYMMLDMFAQELFGRLERIYLQVPAPELDEILRQEFGGEDAAFWAFLFSAANIYRHNSICNAQRIAELENKPHRTI